MIKWIKILGLILISLVLVLIILSSFLSIFGDGFFYWINQPVPVEVLGPSQIRLTLTRYSRFNMAGMCANELHCKSAVIELSYQGCPLEAGERTFPWILDLPFDNLEGPCHIRGTVDYRIMFAPSTYWWESETFVLPESEEQ